MDEGHLAELPGEKLFMLDHIAVMQHEQLRLFGILRIDVAMIVQILLEIGQVFIQQGIVYDDLSDDDKEVFADYNDIQKENGFDLDIEHSVLTKEIIDHLHSLGIEVNCWTCDDPQRGELLASWGIDYITSNILE